MCLNEDWEWIRQNFFENFVAKEINEIDKNLNENNLEINDSLAQKNKYGVWSMLMCSIVSLMCPDNNFALNILSQIKSKINSFDKGENFFKIMITE